MRVNYSLDQAAAADLSGILDRFLATK